MPVGTSHPVALPPLLCTESRLPGLAPAAQHPSGGDEQQLNAPFSHPTACAPQSTTPQSIAPLFPLRSTLLEETSGNSVSRSPSQRVYPFSMDNGVPLNCKWYGGIQSCSTSERWAGLFEVSCVAGGGVGSLGGGPQSGCWSCLLFKMRALSWRDGSSDRLPQLAA